MERVRIQKSADSDFLWGAQAIAGFLGLEVPKVYYLVHKKRIPVTKLSRGLLVARKSELYMLLSSSKEQRHEQ